MNTTTRIHMDFYVSALKEHDWSHAYSDDARVWRSGRDSLTALQASQALIDPEFAVWNAHAPEDYQMHVVPGQTGSAP